MSQGKSRNSLVDHACFSYAFSIVLFTQPRADGLDPSRPFVGTEGAVCALVYIQCKPFGGTDGCRIVPSAPRQWPQVDHGSIPKGASAPRARNVPIVKGVSYTILQVSDPICSFRDRREFSGGDCAGAVWHRASELTQSFQRATVSTCDVSELSPASPIPVR
jgi:hypothetical protein